MGWRNALGTAYGMLLGYLSRIRVAYRSDAKNLLIAKLREPNSSPFG